jgi:hypothetical protein
MQPRGLHLSDTQAGTTAPNAGAAPPLPAREGSAKSRRVTPFERRARLVVQFAQELSGQPASVAGADIRLPLSAAEFQRELVRRYGDRYPDLAFRSEATVERARLQRKKLPGLPRVILRQGPPPRSAAS